MVAYNHCVSYHIHKYIIIFVIGLNLFFYCFWFYNLITLLK